VQSPDLSEESLDLTSPINDVMKSLITIATRHGRFRPFVVEPIVVEHGNDSRSIAYRLVLNSVALLTR